jgi:hypothetical protein
MHQTVPPIPLVCVTINKLYLSITYSIELCTNISNVDIPILEMDYTMIWCL